MLSAKLPDYLIPLRLFALEAMPLDINGNIDRKALPDPFVATNAQAADGAVAEAALGTAPELADIEHQISAIWTQLPGYSEELIQREILLMCSHPDESRPAGLAQTGLAFSDYVHSLHRGPQGMTQNPPLKHFLPQKFSTYKNIARNRRLSKPNKSATWI